MKGIGSSDIRHNNGGWNNNNNRNEEKREDEKNDDPPFDEDFDSYDGGCCCGIEIHFNLKNSSLLSILNPLQSIVLGLFLK